MTISAISWAFDLELRPASLKLILISLCDYSDVNGLVYPSIAALEYKTSLDRKTLIKGIDALELRGFLEDTGKRCGVTGQVKIYRLVGLDLNISHYVYRVFSPESGQFYIGLRTCMGLPEHDCSYFGSGYWPIEMVKNKIIIEKTIIGVFPTRRLAAQKEAALIKEHKNDNLFMNGTKNGSLLKTPKNGTVKGSRFSHERVPFFPSKAPKNGTVNRQVNRYGIKAEAISPPRAVDTSLPAASSPQTLLTSKSKKKQGTRIDDDWKLSEAMGRWAEKERNISPQKILQMADRFKDHWISIPGHQGLKLDWNATWRNWVRREKL